MTIFPVRTAIVSCALAMAAGGSLRQLPLHGGQPSTPGSTPDAPAIVVGPNVPVSDDPSRPHYETSIASHPSDARRLVGAAMVVANRRIWGAVTRTYASADGGATWSTATFPGQQDVGGGDPWVDFGPDGTAYFATLVHREGRSFLYVHRSDDGGQTWSAPTDLGKSYDRLNLVVDRTAGPSRGNVYITVMTARPPGQTLVVFRSTDGARTFAPPVVAAEMRAIRAEKPAILSDGTLVVPYFVWPGTGKEANTFGIMVSTDGARTFSERRPVGAQHRPDDSRRNAWADRGIREGHAQYAAGPPTGRFRDRLYALWNDSRTGDHRLYISSTDDRGLTWRPPLAVDGAAPAGSAQFQPMLAVNGDGTVGVAWLDSRAEQPGSDDILYDLYFTASLDGAASFLPARRVTRVSSRPTAGGNSQPALVGSTIESRSGLLAFKVASGHSGKPGGGDYMAMTASADRAFFPMWIDCRTGQSEVYTTRIDVANGRAAVPQGLTTADVTSSVEVVFGAGDYDPTRQEVAIPIRLRNVGTAAVHAPITVTMEKSAFDWQVILNASNGKPGDGATFDYTPALGDWTALAPGATTEPVIWRFRARNPGESAAQAFLRVHGRVEPAAGGQRP